MSETNDLLAELDAEFGKKKKEKNNGKLQVIAKKLAREQFASHADWQLALIMQESNRIAQQETFNELWKPEARETWVMYQHCVCCARVTEYIAGEYVRFRNTRAHAMMKRRCSSCPDEFHFNKGIPAETIYLEQDVGRCPKCIHEEQEFDEIWERVQQQAAAQPEAQLNIPGLEEK